MENFWSRLLWIMAFFSVIFGVAQMQLSVHGGVVSIIGALLMVPFVADRAGRLMGRLWWSPPIVGFLVATLVGPIVTFSTAPTLEELLERSTVLQHLSHGPVQATQQAA